MKIRNSILVLLVLVLSFVNVQAQSAPKLDKMNHELIPYFEEVKVGESAKYELNVTNSYNSELPDAQLVVTLPREVLTGEVTLTSKPESLKINGTVPVIKEDVIVYDTINSKEAFDTSLIIEFKTDNGEPLNDRVLTVSTKLTQGEYLQEKVAQSTLKAAWNIALTNDLLGTMKTESSELVTSDALIQNEYALFGIGVSVNKLESGTMRLSDNQITVTQTLPQGVKYVSDNSGVEPTISKNDQQDSVIVWKFDNNKETDQNYFDLTFDVKVHVFDEDFQLPNYSKYTSIIDVDIIFADGEQRNANSKATSLVIVEEGSLPPITHGRRYLPRFSGPSDAEGNISTPGENLDITVNDSAYLGWGLLPTPISATNAHTDLYTYDVFFMPDENQRIESLYTGDHFFRPNVNFPEESSTNLNDQTFMSFSVLYAGDSDWSRLKETIYPSTTYSALELGIDSTRPIEAVWMAYHGNKPQDVKFPEHIGHSEENPTERGKIPAGLTTHTMKFYTVVEKGYVGKLSGKFAQSFSGFNSQNTELGQYTPFLNDLINTGKIAKTENTTESPNVGYYIPKMSVNVVSPTDADSRVIQASVKFLEETQSTVKSGENFINIGIKSDESSKRSITGPFVLKVLLPEEVTLEKNKVSEFFEVTSVEENYNDSNRELITMKLNDNTTLTPGKGKNLMLPVVIGEKAPYLLETELVGYMNEEFTVSNSPNDVGYLTQIIKDPFTEGSDVDVYSVKNISTYRHAYEHHLIASAYDSISGSFATNATVETGNDVLVQLDIYNDLETAIKDLELIYTLPRIVDANLQKVSTQGITKDFFLKDAVNLGDLEEMFYVYYSYSDNIEDSEWLEFSNELELNQVQSIKIVKKENSRSIFAPDVKVKLTLESNVAAFKNDLQKTAAQSFSVSLNSKPNLESAPSFIHIKSPELPIEPELPIKPELPKEPSKPAIPKEPTDSSQLGDTQNSDDIPKTGITRSMYAMNILLILSLGFLYFSRRFMKREESNTNY